MVRSWLAPALFLIGGSACSAQEAAGQPSDSREVEPTPRWVALFAGLGGDAVAEVAAAPDGTIYVAGQFEEEIEIGTDLPSRGQIAPGPPARRPERPRWGLRSAGDSDGFVAAFAQSGEPLWAERFGGARFDAITALAILPGGGVAVAGSTTRALPGSRAGGREELFVMALSRTGERAWTWKAADGPRTAPDASGGAGWVAASALAASADGGIFLAGTHGDLEVGPGQRGTVRTGGGDAVVHHIGPAGELVWQRRLGGAGWDQATGVTTRAGGGAVVVGCFAGTAGFGATHLTALGRSDGFAVALSPGGEPEWARRMGGTGEDCAMAALTTPDGRIAVAGQFERSMQLGAEVLRSAGQSDLFVALLEPSGEVVSATRQGDAGADAARSIAVRPDGALVVAGTGSAVPDLGGARGPTEAAVWLVEADGVPRRWLRMSGSYVSATAATLPDGGLALGGTFVRAARLGGARLTGVAGLDGYLLLIAGD